MRAQTFQALQPQVRRRLATLRVEPAIHKWILEHDPNSWAALADNPSVRPGVFLTEFITFAYLTSIELTLEDVDLGRCALAKLERRFPAEAAAALAAEPWEKMR